ncbi:MAG: DNA gyrase subunit A [Elusimicrobia bacterium]|nr:DNA gyrase subunit A [Elusimicrobiota bacterium]
MAKESAATKDKPEEPIGSIIPRDIGEEMKSSYIDYAMSVIVGRALPDVRDGLKPVHRRILYTMEEMGLKHNRPYKKCAKIVGEVLGKYHPHGDMAVYDSLVRMVQNFSLRHPLIDGQGNFGSIDGDPPAAYRYTEARLAAIADELLTDIDKDTVSFVPTYDNSSMEPTVLPAKLPNLMINGSSGIAVGMATNMPPHNLVEICDAAIAISKDPEIETKELMKILKGPDFPTGGIIRGRSGIKDYFETGRGSVHIQAKTEIEEIRGSRQAIIVTELPYQVNKAQLLETIAGLVREKKIVDISDMRDESDRRGMRMVIEIKREGNSQVVLNQLFKHTQMEISFGVINLALVDGRPRVLPVKEILGQYLRHRRIVVTRRTEFELKKAQERAHILEGFRVALKHLDRVIKIIRQSKDSEEARFKLIDEFELTKIQAQAILDMRLHQLTRLEAGAIEEEYKGLQKAIEEYKGILGDLKKVVGIVVKELEDLKTRYAQPRRTQITGETTELSMEDLIPEEDMVVSLSHGGYVKRLRLDTYRAQGRGGKGVMGADMKEEDFIEHLFITSSHATLLLFTNRGRVYALKAYEIPEAGRQARGKAVVNLVALSGTEEKITSAVAIRSFEETKGVESFLMMCTRAGTIKKTSLADFSNIRKTGIAAINLREGDVLVDVQLTNGDYEIMIGTKQGMSIRFSESDVRPMGRVSTGVRGISLSKGDEVVGMEAVPPKSSATLLTVCENGYGKRTDLSEYRDQSRGGRGVITIKATERNGAVAGIKLVKDREDLMIMTERGKMIRIRSSDIKVISRNTQGVRLVRLEDQDKVARVAPIAENGAEE